MRPVPATVALALESLADGKLPKQVAYELGYTSPDFVWRVLRRHRKAHGFSTNYQAVAAFAVERAKKA